MEQNKHVIKKENKINIVPIMIALLLGGFISLLNETLLNVAFPNLMADFNISAGTVQWIATAYMLIIGILVPVTAFLIQSFTTKQLYLAAMFLFTIGTILAGFSNTFQLLLIARMIQGLGTGMLMPLMMNTVISINPPEKRGSAMGTCLLVVLFAPAIGPTLSGLLLQFLSWHWLFFCILPFAIIATILGAIYLNNVTELTKPKIDILSILLSTIGFGGIIFGISSAESMGLFSIEVITSFILGIIGLIIFTRRQFHLKQPMLEPGVFKYPMYTLGVCIIVITMMIIFSINIILPTFLQSALNMSPFVAGIALLPGGLISGFMTPITGKIYDKHGAKVLLIPGFAIMAVSMGLLSRISTTTSLTFIITLHCFIFLGVSMVMTPTQTNSLNQLPPRYAPHGIAIINTFQQIAAAAGSSLFIGMMAVGQKDYLKNINSPSNIDKQAAVVFGVNNSFKIALGILIAGFLISLFIKNAKIVSKQHS